METLTSTTSLTEYHQSSNYDDISKHQSLVFSDSLKDLKKLQMQLYSAAEYFELSYANDDEKDIVVDTLKDYAIKALVNTVDHLDLVSYKVNDLLDEKVDEVNGTEFRVSSIEQRLRTCQDYIDQEGLAQQSSVISAPKYHKRYVLPDGQTMNGGNLANLKYKGCGIDEDEWLQFRNAVRVTVTETPSLVRRGRSTSPIPRHAHLPGSFSFTPTTPRPRKDQDRRSVSPQRFPLLRSGSFASRPMTPKSSRSTTPNPAFERRQYLSESRKSASMRVHDEKEKRKEMDIERQPSRGKRLLKALLSRRKSKKDDMLFTYLDEY